MAVGVESALAGAQAVRRKAESRRQVKNRCMRVIVPSSWVV
jgi:hypothetical protein